jgi:hypothetical protein
MWTRKIIFIFGLLTAVTLSARGDTRHGRIKPYFEKIDRLIDLKPHRDFSDQKVSITQTRIDIFVKNSVARYRIIQNYYNHTKVNQGHWFRAPLGADTVITGFRLWDQGKLYKATFEDKQSAEDAYREITRDETPTITKDPGIVRQGGNQFEMRIFPIFPGENKQAELRYFSRLAMNESSFALNLPTSSLLQVLSPEKRSSQSVKISLHIEDELEFKMNSNLAWRSIINGKKEQTLEWSGTAADLASAPKIQITPRIDKPSVAVTTYSDGGRHFFQARVLAPAAKMQSKPVPNRANPFYIAVVHGPTKTISETDQEMAFNLEALGYLTLAAFDGSARFYGGWQPSRLPAATDWPYRFLALRHAYQVSEAGTALNEVMRPKNNKDIPQMEFVAHLRQTVANEKLEFAYLFLEELLPQQYKDLAAAIAENPRTHFYVISGDNSIYWRFGLKSNVSIYQLGRGWRQLNYPVPRRQLMAIKFSDLREFAPILGPYVTEVTNLWQSLAHTRMNLPALKMDKEAALKNVASVVSTPQIQATQLIWLTGEYSRPSATISLTHLGEEFFSHRFFSRGRKDTDPMSPSVPDATIEVELKFPQPEVHNAYVAALALRPQAEYLSARINMLRWNAGARRRTKDKVEQKNILDAINRRAFPLRRQLVHMSKKYEFLTSETALIALPPALQKKYGFSARASATGANNLSALKAGKGIPEPSEWAMLLALLMGIGTAWIIRRRRRSNAQS